MIILYQVAKIVVQIKVESMNMVVLAGYDKSEFQSSGKT